MQNYIFCDLHCLELQINYWLKIWEGEQVVINFNSFFWGARVWDTAVFLVWQCQISALLFKLEQTPTAWLCLRRKGLAWRYNYLIVWRMETHHHKASCRIHKELLANTEVFKYCPTPEESHRRLAIVFPVEILVRDVGRVLWIVGRTDCLGLVNGFLANKLVVPCLIALSPTHAFSIRVSWGPRRLLYVLVISLSPVPTTLPGTEKMFVWRIYGCRHYLPMKGGFGYQLPSSPMELAHGQLQISWQ